MKKPWPWQRKDTDDGQEADNTGGGFSAGPPGSSSESKMHDGDGEKTEFGASALSGAKPTVGDVLGDLVPGTPGGNNEDRGEMMPPLDEPADELDRGESADEESVPDDES